MTFLSDTVQAGEGFKGAKVGAYHAPANEHPEENPSSIS